MKTDKQGYSGNAGNVGNQGFQEKQDKLRSVERAPADASAPPTQLGAIFRKELEAGVTSSLPLDTYVKEVCTYLHDAKIHGKTVKDWRIFQFARFMKAHPVLTTLTADHAFGDIDWSRTPWTKDEDAHAEFLVVWNHVRFLPGKEPLDWAVEMAEEFPLRPGRCRGGRFEKYAKFVSIAGWLQVLVGDNRILLPCERISELIPCRKNTVSRYRSLAQTDGYLKLVRKHSLKSGRASEFRFKVWKFPTLRKWSEDHRG